MRTNLLVRFLLATALLILAIPVVASAQYYRDRYYNPDYRDQYNQNNNYDVRAAINRLANSSVRLENDLNYTNRRRVFGIFEFSTVDNTAIAEVRDFRRAVWQLRRASGGGSDLSNSYDEARTVIDQGARLDRYLRLRTSSTSVDQDLSELRSNLQVIAEAYGMNTRY